MSEKSRLMAEVDAIVQQRRMARPPPLPPVGEPLQNPRHELFVQCLLGDHMSYKEAYLAAGYSDNPASVKGNAHKLRWHPDIAERIQQIQEHVAAAIMRRRLN